MRGEESQGTAKNVKQVSLPVFNSEWICSSLLKLVGLRPLTQARCWSSSFIFIVLFGIFKSRRERAVTITGNIFMTVLRTISPRKIMLSLSLAKVLFYAF